MYFEFIEFGSVLDVRKFRKSLVIIQIGGQVVEIKVDIGVEVMVILYYLYQKIIKKFFQQIQ